MDNYSSMFSGETFTLDSVAAKSPGHLLSCPRSLNTVALRNREKDDRELFRIASVSAKINRRKIQEFTCWAPASRVAEVSREE
jgi:hypothetical protein